MIIQVSGYKEIEYTNKNNQLVKGIEVHGIQTKPDYVDPKVHGDLTFAAFFSLQNLEGVLPNEGEEYEVVFAIQEFAGEYRARPHHLKEV